MEALLKLFRAVLIDCSISKKRSLQKNLLKRTVKSGFILDDKITKSYSADYLEKLIIKIEEIIGLNGEQLNQTFHKSWKKVKEASIEQLFLEQIIHYITTYGFEALGCYDKDSIFIPIEELKIPKLKIDKLNLIVIKGYTKEELKRKLIILLSGIALKEETLKLILDAIIYLGFNIDELEIIKNKEMKMYLYDHLKVVPKDPVEFLRYLIFKSTGKTLLIKDQETITKIKQSDEKQNFIIFDQYIKLYGMEKLAEIFFRFKPLFLAFRGDPTMNYIINRIRKLAKTCHKPMPVDYLNSVTDKIKNSPQIIGKRLENELSKVNIFRRIRLAYALKFRTFDNDSILYKIRNGKSYAKEFYFCYKKYASNTLDIVLNSISNDLSKLKDKKIYIPDNIIYPLPATEKQFTGMLPSGTCINIPTNMIFGVHWENVDGNRIDLDLSLVGMNIKFGWDAYYRDKDRTILFSGDMTDANRGATELYYINEQHQGNYILFLNYYNYNSSSLPVPFKAFVASKKLNHLPKNYTVNPNDIILSTDSVIDKSQKALGLVVVDDKSARFYFSETNIGKSITSSNTVWSEQTRKYLLNYHENMIDIKEVLLKAGAKLISDPKKADIDLSPEKLEKDTFINLLS